MAQPWPLWRLLVAGLRCCRISERCVWFPRRRCLQGGSVSNELLSNSDSSSLGKAIDAYPNHKRMPLDGVSKPAGLPSQAFDPCPPGEVGLHSVA
jgi:hypothetical protein